MIHAQKKGPWAALVGWYFGYKFSSAFAGLYVRGELPRNERRGLVVYANHSSFWDGFVIHQLGKLARWDAYAVMEERQLARYRFHTRVGAFSVRRGEASSARGTLHYAKALLQKPAGAVFIFPQGALRPASASLGPVERGAQVLAKAAGALMMPIALRYAFFEGEKPVVLVDVGAPHEAGDGESFEARLSALTAQVLSVTSTDGFTCAVRGSAGTQAQWDTARGEAMHE